MNEIVNNTSLKTIDNKNNNNMNITNEMNCFDVNSPTISINFKQTNFQLE